MLIKDILEKLLKGDKIDNILLQDNDSQNGFIIEAIYKILVIDKYITSIHINYDKIYKCQMDNSVTSSPISNIKEIYNENVSNKSGGKSDFTSKFDDVFTFTSSKYVSKFIPGKVTWN